MSRDIDDRLFTFDVDVEVKRIALTMKQVEEVEPPPNPTKYTDSRAGGYVARYGDESWELDALDPTYLTTLIEEEVAALTDPELLQNRIDVQEKERAKLRSLINRL